MPTRHSRSRICQGIQGRATDGLYWAIRSSGVGLHFGRFRRGHLRTALASKAHPGTRDTDWQHVEQGRLCCGTETGVRRHALARANCWLGMRRHASGTSRVYLFWGTSCSGGTSFQGIVHIVFMPGIVAKDVKHAPNLMPDVPGVCAGAIRFGCVYL